jgi:ethanolamine utilization cobalamin adenosyltransferase
VFIYLLLFQGSTSLSAQQQQLQQLQLLQQQLIQQTQLMQQSTGQQPVIDNNLLSHIQTLTSQLLNKKPPCLTVLNRELILIKTRPSIFFAELF